METITLIDGFDYTQKLECALTAEEWRATYDYIKSEGGRSVGFFDWLLLLDKENKLLFDVRPINERRASCFPVDPLP